MPRRPPRAALVSTAAALAALLAGSGPAQAETAFSDAVIRIGVLNDMHGVYADVSGTGSMEAAMMAVEDFGGNVLGVPVEVLHADHRNDPAHAVALAERWIAEDGVDVIADMPNSDVMMAVQEVGRRTGTILLAVGAASTDFTGMKCSPYGFHWAYDTYALATGTAKAVAAAGGTEWFNIVADYGFGHALDAATRDALYAAGGRVVDATLHPLGTPDLSDAILQAQASQARVVGLINAGSDMVRSVMHAVEFGLPRNGQTLAAMLGFIQNIHALGLDVAQGLVMTTAFYWDRTEESRTWSRRFHDRTGQMPSMIHAGVYSAVLHALKAMEAGGTDEAGTVAAIMRAQPVDDVFASDGHIRDDGRMVHDMYLVRAKRPEDSTGPWDLFEIIATIPGETAAMPLSESRCPLVTR